MYREFLTHPGPCECVQNFFSRISTKKRDICHFQLKQFRSYGNGDNLIKNNFFQPNK